MLAQEAKTHQQLLHPDNRWFINSTSIEQLPHVSYIYVFDDDEEVVFILKEIKVVHDVGVNQVFHDLCLSLYYFDFDVWI